MKKQKLKVDWLELSLQIIVVFIGVTMGFAINNWAANRHDNQLEERYLSALKKDIEANIATLEGFLHRDSLWVSRSEKLLEQAETDDNVIQDSLRIILNMMSSADVLLTQESTYSSMEKSGEINLISDFNLKTEITRYYGGTVLQAEFLDQNYFKFVSNTIVPFAIETFDSKNGVFISPKRDEIKYYNLFKVGLQHRKLMIANYQNLLSHSKYLTKELE